jgi:hypothetical protein
MRISGLTVAIALLCPAFSANAQNFCSQVDSVAAQAASDFGKIHGSWDQNLNLWNATQRLPNAESCYVYPKDGDSQPFYSCSWYFQTEDALESAHQSMVDGLKQCPNWQTARVKTGHFDSSSSSHDRVSFTRATDEVTITRTHTLKPKDRFRLNLDANRVHDDD